MDTDQKPGTAITDDGTTLGEARRLVANWQTAHGLQYLSPRLMEDLAERIERAILHEMGGGSED
jgi:hypothetical protein